MLALLSTAACQPPRSTPPVPGGEWSSTLGNSSRSAFAGESVPDSLAEVWRKGVDRGLAIGPQLHGPIIVATTTGRAVVTLSAESGMQYWSRRFNGPIAGSALRLDDRVFIATGDRENRVHALHIRRGRTLWSKRVGEIRVEPLLIDTLLVVVTESGDVIALRTDDGEERWRLSLGSSPAVAPVLAGAVFVATSRDTLVAIDVGAGRIVDRLALPATPSAPLLVHEDGVVLALHGGAVVRVSAGDRRTIDWQAAVGATVLAPPVALGPAVYVLTRDAEVWRIRNARADRLVSLGGAASGSLAVVGSSLLVGRLDGMLFTLDGNGRVTWQSDMGDSVIAPVAARDGEVFVPLLRGTLVKLR